MVCCIAFTIISFPLVQKTYAISFLPIYLDQTSLNCKVFNLCFEFNIKSLNNLCTAHNTIMCCSSQCCLFVCFIIVLFVFFSILSGYYGHFDTRIYMCTLTAYLLADRILSITFLAHLWGAYAIPLALSVVRCPSSVVRRVSPVSTITTRNN